MQVPVWYCTRTKLTCETSPDALKEEVILGVPTFYTAKPFPRGLVQTFEPGGLGWVELYLPWSRSWGSVPRVLLTGMSSSGLCWTDSGCEVMTENRYLQGEMILICLVFSPPLLCFLTSEEWRLDWLAPSSGPQQYKMCLKNSTGKTLRHLHQQKSSLCFSAFRKKLSLNSFCEQVFQITSSRITSQSIRWEFIAPTQLSVGWQSVSQHHQAGSPGKVESFLRKPGCVPCSCCATGSCWLKIQAFKKLLCVLLGFKGCYKYLFKKPKTRVQQPLSV